MDGKNVHIFNDDKSTIDKNKFQIDLNNLNQIPKLNLSKLKFLKPKIDASNGGHSNMLKLNLNLLNLNNCGNGKILEKNKNLQNFNCEKLLRHPKIKNLKKLKETKTDNINNYFPKVETQSENKIKDDSDYLIRTDKELLDSTNVSNLNVNPQNLNMELLSANSHNNFNFKNPDKNSKKEKVSSMVLDQEKFYKRNFSINNSDSLKSEKDKKAIDVFDLTHQKEKIPIPLESPENKRSRNKNKHNFEENIKLNKSTVTISKKTNSFLDISLTLNSNLQKLANKLKRDKGINHKKERKVEILKSMVEGLTNLTTIMLEDSNSESEYDKNDFSKIPNLKHKKKNNLLICSTTGNIIKNEKGKILTNSILNSNKNTIDYNQTIKYKQKEKYTSQCFLYKTFSNEDSNKNKNFPFYKNSRKNSKIKIEGLNKTFDKKSERSISSKNQNKNFYTNNSLIMEVMQVDKNNLSNKTRLSLSKSKSKSKNKIKNLIKNRYSLCSSNRSNSSIKRTATATITKADSTYSDLNFNFKTICDTNEIFYKKNKSISKDKSKQFNNFPAIDCNKDFITLNRNYLNNLSTINSDNQKFKIDKFDFRISRNFNQKPMRVFEVKEDCKVLNNFDRNKFMNKKQININDSVKKNETIQSEDFLPNYEFVD